MKRIVSIGGGPAGLYAAILLRKAMPTVEVEVIERNRSDDTFGWGVVFSDQTMAGFRDLDPPTHAAIEASFRHWDDIEVHHRGECLRSTGHGFCGIGRKRLLNILQERAAELGVRQRFETEVDPQRGLDDADLVIAADGVNSRMRGRHAGVFKPDIEIGKCRYIWLGTRKLFDAFTFAFEKTEHGWFQIHAYQFSDELSTVIVETREETWLSHGLDQADTAQSIDFCERLFACYLDGHRLMSNAAHLRGSAWLNFQRVICERWHHGNLVLIGDAAHTAHFSIGSGTKLAMEDAAALVRHITSTADVQQGLERYHAERSIEALKLQNAARNRMEWFENVERYVQLEPWQFNYSLLTGSQRIGHANLAQRDPGCVAEVERRLAVAAGVLDVQGRAAQRPPMFLPLQIRGLTLANRVVVSPMAQYSAIDGLPGDWHLMHYGARAVGGAGLVLTEMTCTSPDARITPGCTGLWSEQHGAAWQRIVDFVHAHSDARIGVQLGHAGRKGSTQVGWERMDHPLATGNWQLLAPSPLPYLDRISATPRAMDREDMARVLGDFLQSTRLAAEAGFDLLELHMAHGYLLASFISPLTNHRTDEYGGDISGRARFPLEVLTAVRSAWPQERPLSVRISASDWAEGGLDETDLIRFVSRLRDAGVDLIDVSTGQTVPWQKPVYGRMWQTPFADLVRSVTGLRVIAVGNISEPDQINTIVAAGRADLCAIARPHLIDAAWTQRAAAEQRYGAQRWPPQYLSARMQFERSLERAAQPAGRV
ncbi:MAG: bifunctional salicylyl-CoA 5-hydroxylase/oxidoreductase [Gammaproteobacteria bacterium]|nr:bifunctional salicylyl-CoA 5-hydroxylase/oxidoreductase [Gammaproteobacteria bacterium]